MSEQGTRKEEFRIRGDEIAAKGKDLLRQGKIRRVLVKDEKGKNVINIPLTLGAAAAFIRPKLAVLGLLATVAMRGSIVVEKEEGQESASDGAVHTTASEDVS